MKVRHAYQRDLLSHLNWYTGSVTQITRNLSCECTLFFPTNNKEKTRPFKETRPIVFPSRFTTFLIIARCATSVTRGLVGSVGGELVGAERCVSSAIWLGERNEGLHNILRLVLLYLRYGILLTLLCPVLSLGSNLDFCPRAAHCWFLESFRSCEASSKPFVSIWARG